MAVITRIDLLKNRRTKIVATLGPVTSSQESIGRLIESGVNMFRLNMSHGDHDTHRSVFQNIKAMSASSGPIAVMADLCGPKIRTGRFVDGGIELIKGQDVRISMENKLGHAGLITSQYKALASDVTPGDRILLADGIFELKVLAIDSDEVICEVIQGGRLTDNKGINLPGVEVS
ncbi:MAG: pyruvate kinase, partial [Candidatus Azotimanducaceae bacterium]